MDRLARHRPAAATVAALTAALAAGGAGCEEPATCAELAAGFALLAPDGPAELVPGGSVHLAWTPTDAPTDLRVELVDGPGRLGLGQIAGAAGALDLERPADDRILVGIFRVEVVLEDCAGAPAVHDAGPLHLIYGQGLRFAAGDLGFTGSQTERTVAITTVTLSTMTVELLADPDEALAGDELLVARAEVPGEVFRRDARLPFTGQTVDGAAVPAGSYRLRARVIARAGALTYETAGPTMTWSPAD